MVGLENFELAGIKSYTRFWGLLMFGSYSVINVIVLLNLLIAMMSNSYAMIDEHSDVEWKFARTRLWMSYFEEVATLPPPFNILPTPKLFLKMLGIRKKDKLRKMKMKEQKEKEHDVRYTAVMRALVWRYVSAKHRKMVDEPVTEDDINELKVDVSALRYELLEVFEKNGMDVSFTDRKEKMVLGKRMKIWERRLMKDFHVAPVSLEDEKLADEDGLSRFRRIVKMAIANTAHGKWDQTLAATGVSSQIGRCRSRESFKNQQTLQRAMEEVKKLVLRSPLPEGSRGVSPIEMPVSPGHTLLELIKDISTEVGEYSEPIASPVPKPEEAGAGAGALLTAAAFRSRPISSKPSSSKAGLATVTKKSEEGESRRADDIVVARPVAPEIKPSGGAIPPPPPVVKPKAPAPTMEVTPSTPPAHAPSVPEVKPPTSPKVAPPPPPPRVASPTPSTSTAAAPPQPPPASLPKRLSSTSSTEQLIPPSSPEPLRPVKKLDEISTIKRQPKTGWL
ncbi:unnamed protein product [Arctia plantaginis]|uniref:Ion transport domain-containing protein n=1 Tax=Arctia plantaginis TaxID=874455 RepID=A0A8S0YZP4_ARCPL|nr:unnamed protein product [Arctia plantaginis]